MYANGSPYDKKTTVANTNNNTSNHAIEQSTTPNGTVHTTSQNVDHTLNSVNREKSAKDTTNDVILKGDLMQRSRAKEEREKRIQRHAKAREKQAQVS